MRFVWLVALLALLLACAQTPSPQPAPPVDGAFALNQKLGKGINLANALEAPNEGDWGVFLTAKFFQDVKAAGFQSVRVPMKWSNHASLQPPYTIKPAFFERIDWVVQQAKANGLNLVLNMHHYDEIHQNPAAHLDRFKAIWRQIAERYRNEPASLYFELLNEPSGAFDQNPALWNTYLAAALAEVRSTNPTRAVIVGPVGYNSWRRLPQLVLPSDPNVIVTVHYYDPFGFTHQGAEWVNPQLPIGQTWQPDTKVLAADWENWSWDTVLTSINQNGTQQMQVGFQKGWAGLYLHNPVGLSGYDTLAFKVNKALSLRVTCTNQEVPGVVLPTTDGWKEYTVSLAACGGGASIKDLKLQNNSPNVPPPFLLDAMELRGPNGIRPLLTSELGAVQSAMQQIKAWSLQNNRPIYVGEFGAYGKGEMPSRVRWTNAVRSEAEKQGFSWAYWELAAGFGLYDSQTGVWTQQLLKALLP